MNHKKNLMAAVLGVACAMPAFAANLVLNNVDAAGVGFNDPTPATAVGGNDGTTVGAQRLVAYRKALELWGKTLRSAVLGTEYLVTLKAQRRADGSLAITHNQPGLDHPVSRDLRPTE